MKENRIENGLIENCAPTLAGMKSAGLFSYSYEGKPHVREELKEINGRLNDRGVYVEVLLWREKSVLIYTYRRGQLKQELERPGVMELLAKYGYPENGVDECIGRNCKCCGLWKVYCNEAEKEKLFDKLKKCSEIYRQVFSEGRSLTQMTVCI